jgi:hypothetical protein
MKAIDVKRVLLLAVCAWLVLALAPVHVVAQGVTTGAISGIVADPQGQPVAGAEVRITHTGTGFTTATLTRANGYYLVQGLEVGGPYRVEVSALGYGAHTTPDIFVRLSATTRVDVRLTVQAVQLERLDITVTRTADISPTRQGVSTVISDTLVRRIPTLSRDFVDLVRLTPQVVRPATGGPSAGGMYNRFNTFTIDGANQSERFNLGSTEGIPGGSAGGRLVSIEAVREFRVMMTPTDVRQGNFAGMLVNAVTKSGANDFTGGGTFAYRNESMSAAALRQTEVSIQQYGFHVGGPIIRDRLHFFVAPEWQQRSTPAAGPFYTAAGSTSPQEPAVALDSIARIRQIMLEQYNFDVGTELPLSIETPLQNLFGRLDFAINDNHRLVFRQLINRTEDGSFSRNNNSLNMSPTVQNSGYRLGSNRFSRVNKNNSSVLQLYSNLGGGLSNEFIAAFNTIRDLREIPVQAPEVSVGVNMGGTVRAVTFGTEQFSPGNQLDQDIFEVVNNFTMPLNRHTLTFGARFDHTTIFNNFAQRSFGVYVFPTIDHLLAATPTGYSVGYDNSGTGQGIPADFRIQMYSLYGQDQWSVNDRLTVTYGLRADIPRFLDTPLRNTRLEAQLDERRGQTGFEDTPVLRTDVTPSTQVLWSPRIGFNYDVTGGQRNQVRGSIGIYTGPPPYILLGNAYANTGLGLVTLSCTGATTPAFTLNVNNLPRACAGQPEPDPGQANTAGINVTDANFRYPQYFATSAGFDQQLPWNTVLTLEGMYRRAINGVLVVDRNIRGPRMVGGQPYTDRHGRVLYADTILATGSVQNANQRYLPSLNEGIIEVSNQSEDYNYTISGQLNRRFWDSFEATLGYTYLQSRDVQSLTSDRAISNWRNGRQLSEAHETLRTTTSVFERPHRVLAYGTYTLPWRITDVSFYYEGISGGPITYVHNGDLNGDGYNGNDPIYVPLDATNPDEIRIGRTVDGEFVDNADDAAAFNAFISEQRCLDQQRGQIMTPNSCRAPFQHRIDMSIRQSIPRLYGQQLALQLDIFNFLNLLNSSWGQVRTPTLSPGFPDQRALIQQGRTPGPLSESQPLLTFDNRLIADGPFGGRTTGSNYMMQLTLRYAF